MQVRGKAFGRQEYLVRINKAALISSWLCLWLPSLYGKRHQLSRNSGAIKLPFKMNAFKERKQVNLIKKKKILSLHNSTGRVQTEQTSDSRMTEVKQPGARLLTEIKITPWRKDTLQTGRGLEQQREGHAGV